jgi:hypothetical protein
MKNPSCCRQLSAHWCTMLVSSSRSQSPHFPSVLTLHVFVSPASNVACSLTVLSHSYSVATAAFLNICCSFQSSVSLSTFHTDTPQGTIPDHIEWFTNIAYLRLSNNGLQGTLPSTLGLLSTLKHLYLNDNKLASAIPAGMHDARRNASVVVYPCQSRNGFCLVTRGCVRVVICAEMHGRMHMCNLKGAVCM